MVERISIGDEVVVRKRYVGEYWYTSNVLTVVGRNVGSHQYSLIVKGGGWSEEEGNTIHEDNVKLHRKRIEIRTDKIDKLLEDS